jgi:hypothetical protein
MKNSLNIPTPEHLVKARGGLDFSFSLPTEPHLYAITKPLKDPSILLTGGCHVDHEGFDLNEIEQAYYENQNVTMTKDPTWYKDGDGKTTAIVQPWVTQTSKILADYIGIQLIVDHSHFVFKFPIEGEAEKQVREYAKQRPELLRLVSTTFKCGLDLCIDLLINEHRSGRVEPFVHIEWDYRSYDEMLNTALDLSKDLKYGDWHKYINTIINFNTSNSLGAFDQADYRAMTMFRDKAYKLIPTLK